MGKYRLQIHIAKQGPFPASALNVRRNGEKRFLILADGDQAISDLRRSIQEQYARLYENEADLTVVQLTNKDCYELDDNFKIRDVFDPLDTVRVVRPQDAPAPKPQPHNHNLLKRKAEKAATPSYVDARSTSSTPSPESSNEGESKRQRKKKRKAEQAAAKAAAAVASSGLFANGGAAIELHEDPATAKNDRPSSDPTGSTPIATALDTSKGKAVEDKESINKKTQEVLKAEQEKAAQEMAKLQKEAEEFARKEAEEKKRKAEAAKKQKQEEKAKKEAEDRARRDAEVKARKDAEDKARKEAEDQARKEAEDQAKKEAEDKAKKDAEEKLKELAAEEEAKARKEAEKVKVAEEKAKAAEEKARRAAEEKARKAAEAAEAKEAKRKAAEETKARLAEERARKAAESKEAKRVAAEEKRQRQAEEKAAKQSKEAGTRGASQSEDATASEAEDDQLSSSEYADVAPLVASQRADPESNATTPELEERPRRKSTVVVEISARTAPIADGILNRLAPGTVPDFLVNAAEDKGSEETLATKATGDESAFATATEHPLSPKKRGRPPKVMAESVMPISPAKASSTKAAESKVPLADTASDPESDQELEVFSFFEEQRLKGQQLPPAIHTPKPVSTFFSAEPYHSIAPQRLTDKPTMVSDSDSDSDASGPDYDAPPSMPPMIVSSRPSISMARPRPESPRGLAISMPKVSSFNAISNTDNRREDVYDSAEDAHDNGALTEDEEEDEPLTRTRKVVLPGVLTPMALVKEEANENEDDGDATKDEKDQLQETSEESAHSDHHNSSDDDSTSSDSESESESDSESESESGSGSRSSEDQEARAVKTEPHINGSHGGGGILSGLLSLQGAGHGSNSKPTAPARTSFFSLTDISAKMGLPVTSLAELTAQGRAKKIGSIGSAIASPASSASSGRKVISGMNGRGAGSSEESSSEDDAESDSDDNTDSSDEEGDAAQKAKAGPQIKIAGKKRRSSTKSAGGGPSGRKKGRLDALF